MNRFLSVDEDHEVVAAIRAAESRTSAEIRVFISHAEMSDVMTEAHRALQQLGMTKTRHRNAVLVFIAPTARKFAIVGDMAAHEKLGDETWCRLAAVLREGLASGNRAGGIVAVLDSVSTELAKHFPPGAGEQNELPDDVVEQ